MLDFAIDFRAEITPHLDRIHPSGANVIHSWLVDLVDAAHASEAIEVKRLAGMVDRKLRLEREWMGQHG